MSIMFPTIFSLGVKDLGDRAMLGAPLIIMAIIGGAVFPPLMGLVSQWLGHIQPAMLSPAICFAIVLIYATRTHRSVRAAEDARPEMAPVV
jgi:FHS family L-fucose permease-like MFS transporter